jgi:hypothetical protein
LKVRSTPPPGGRWMAPANFMFPTAST